MMKNKNFKSLNQPDLKDIKVFLLTASVPPDKLSKTAA